MFGDLGKMMKMLGQVKTKLPEMQARLAESQYTAEAGGSVVAATVNGKGSLVDLRLDEKLLADGDAEMLADLVKAAVTAAQDKANEAATEAMKELTGGVDLPGLGGLMP